MEFLPGEDGHQNGEVCREYGYYSHEENSDHDNWCCPDGAHCFLDVGNDMGGPRLYRGDYFKGHEQEAPDDGDIAQTVQKETERRAHSSDDQSRDGRSDRPCRVEDGGIHGDGIHKVFFPYQLDDE